MKNILHTLRSCVALTILVLGCICNLNAQTLISPTGDGGFENGSTFAANGWTEVNGTPGTNNNFFIGGVAVASAGSNSAYISNDAAGATWAYNGGLANTVHFYRDVTFPAGQTNITLTFKWKGTGESSFDYLTVYSMPTSQTPVLNSPAGAFQSWLNIPTAYPGAVVHASPPNLNVQTVYQTQTICLPASYAGTTRRLVFMWSNDGSVAGANPGSIDEISLVAAGAPTIPSAQPTSLVLTPTSSTVGGSFTAAAGAPSGYLVVRTSSPTPPTAPVDNTTYTPGASALGGVIVSSSALTTFTATGLVPSTQYYFWVYSFNGSQCGGPIYLPSSPLSGTATTAGCSVTGTRTVGPTGFYPSITAGIADLQANGLSGPVILELQTTYVSSAEPAFPIVIPELLCASAVNNLTIRPQTGSVGLSIASTSTIGTISFNAGDFVTIDGRAGGVGVSQLTISNTTTTGYAVQLINGATSNALRFCSLVGVNTSTANGVVWFSTTNTPMGNSNNIIDNCTIRDGLTTPTNGVYASGTITTLATHNTNNTISNCNIFNTFAAASTSYAINVIGGNTDWTISGNSIYQTATRSSSTIWGGIQISNTTTGNNFLVTGNFIGGNAPLCGGAALTFSGTTVNFRGINLSLAAGVVSIISNNTIQNLNITTTNISGFNAAILGAQGLINITGNTIGLASSTNSIVVSASGSAFNFCGIICGGGTPANLMNITGNTIAGIQMVVTGVPATVPGLRLISVQSTLAGSSYNVNNNTVGSTTVANSCTLNGNSSLLGIISFSIGVGQSMSQNTIGNLANLNTGLAASVTGMSAQGSGTSPNILGTFNVTGNTIRDLSSASASTTIVSALGFTIFGNGQTTGSNTVSQNNIFNISNSNNTAVATAAFGAVFNLPPAIPSLIERNNIHSISLANISSSGLNGVTGLQINTGNGTYQNNFIRVGVDGAGVDNNGNFIVTGITEAAGTNSIIFNSIYVGGQAVATGTSNSFAFRSTNVTAGRVVRNNIFFNNRSNAAGTGLNYALSLPGTVASQAGLVCDNNILFAPGTGGNLGLFNALPYNTLAAWRTATGMDWASLSANPQYIAPNGTSTTVDLHIQAAAATPVESSGAPIASAPQDFDAQTRASLTPTDIGADAGNFTPVADLTPPGISYIRLPATVCGTTDIALNDVLISDLTGVPTAGALRPRVYYRKASGTWFSQPGTLASGTATNGSWNFTIVAADMGGLATADVVSYYVIAQDIVATPNIGSFIGGVVATDVNTVITHPVNAFTTIIQSNLTGTIPVGIVGTYTTLTLGAAAYNAGCVSGNVVFSLTDVNYPTETFPITFNAIPTASASNTLTIKPAPGNSPTISGSSATCLIRFNGADWITIDGSNTIGGTTRDLTLTNTSIATNTAVVCVQSLGTGLGATNDAIRNTNIIGGSNTVATFGIHVAGTTVTTTATGDDNDNLTIQNNNINTVQYGIYARASSVAGDLGGLSITQNSIGSANPANYVVLRGIDLAFINGAVISQNNIFNLRSTTLTTLIGIENNGGIQNSSFTRNNITGIYAENTGGWGAYGINFNTATSVTNNLIANNFISDLRTVNYFSGTTFNPFGIRLVGGTNFTVANNSVHLFGLVTVGTGTTSTPSAFIATSTLVIGTVLKNNIFFNEQSFSLGTTSRAYSVYVPTGFVFADINNNDYFGISTAPTVYTVGFNGVNQLTLADWEAAYPADALSLNINPTFTSDTDLHIVSNECINQGGMPVAGVTVDYDGMARNATRPDIGADEFNGTDVTFAFTENSGIAANDGITCSGALVTLTATNGASYLWSPGGATTASINVNPIATTPYSVTVTLAAGCSRIFTQTITVNPNPTTAITPNPAAICAGQSITLSASGTGTFAWSTPPGGSANPITVSPAMSTTYSVTLTNSNGCSATDSRTVIVNPLPIAGILPASVTICAGQSATLTASGGGTYAWSTPPGGTDNPIVVSPITTTSYTVTVTSGAGCTAVATRTVNVNPITTVTPSVTLPSDCFAPNGSITLTLGGAAGPYTFNWTTSGGSGLINGNQNQTSLTAGAYFVTVTAGNGCTTTNTISLDLNPSCSTCPAIGSLTSSVTNSCKQTNFTLTASGLVGMGSTYGIQFKYSATALVNPYVGGISLGTIANGALTSGGTVATLSAPIPTAGTYFLYAILSPVPGDPTCRPSRSANISIQNCEPFISDPCSCINNATTLTNGQFNEVITVNAPSGQSWTISAVAGLFQPSSPAPPGAPINFPIGFVLTEVPLGGGISNYTLSGKHVDAIGYTVSVTNGSVTLGIGNNCFYPNPQINGLNLTYCANDANVTLNGTATLGGPPGGAATGTGSFTVNGAPNTIFSPSTLGAGTYPVIFTFDADNGVPTGAHPGCIQAITQSVTVNPVPTIVAVPSVSYCVGNVVPASNFTGTPVGGVVFTWVRTPGAIGLAPLNGVGNVPSFVATNAGATAISSTFTVTPTFTSGGVTCTGTPIMYTITINPTPTVTPQTNKIFCSGLPTGGIAFTGTATSYTWVNSNTGIGIPASGTGNIASWIPINLGALPIVGIIIVTPIFTGGGVNCPGAPNTFTVTILPAPRAVCQPATIFLDAAGNATLTIAQVNNGSLGGTITLSKTAFTCGNIGLNNVVLTVTDACLQTSSCVAVVTVVDNIPPTLTCPGNISIVLDPGECDKGIYFTNPSAFDNCEIAITTGMITSTFNSNNQFAGNMFNLTNNTTSPITINSFDGNINSAVGLPVSFQIFNTNPGINTYVGNTNNPAVWTSMGTANSTSAGINLPTNVPIGGLVLQPGETRGIYFILTSYNIATNSLRYTNNNNVYTNGDMTITTGIGKATPNFTGTNFAARSWNGTIRYSKIIGAPPTVVQIDNSGYTNGDLFPIGTTCLTYRATDFAGNTSTCQFCIIIAEYPNAKTALVCNDQIQVSLDEDCEALVGADDLLEGGPYGCYNDYIVEIYQNGKLIPGSPVINGSYIGDVLTGKVFDPVTGNSCWSNITVEDKLPPVLDCSDNVINCEDPITPGTTATVVQKFQTGAIPIADNALTTINLSTSGLPNPASVQNLDLNIFVDISHTWIGDIDAVLITPTGGTIRLFDRPGVPATGFGCANNNLQVMFDDQATLTAAQLEATCNTGAYAIQGTYQPINALTNATNVANMNGNYQLLVRDYAGGDAGALITLRFEFKYQNTLYNPDPTALDGCDNFVDVSFIDVVANQACASPYSKIITRTWKATDDYSNVDQCTQTIFVLRKQLADVLLPPNYDDIDEPALSCNDDYPTVAVTGSPVLGDCSNIGCTFKDQVIDVCQKSYKVIRTWTCLDWCTGVLVTHDQIIKVLDKIGPDFVCPSADQIIVSAIQPGSNNYQGCTAIVQLPWIAISDNCSTLNNIDVVVSTVDAQGFLYSATDPGADNFFVLELTPGNYTFTYTATDDCGNITFCTVVKQIKDGVSPVAVCDDAHNISLTDSVTVVSAVTFDDGSFDDCGPITFTARRLDNPKCQGNDATPFGPTVPFYCCDAKGGQDVTVELRVTDLDGNINTCWSVVKVEDKIRPAITCPPDITVWCGQPYTPTNLDTTIVCQTIGANISEVYARKYQFPIDVEGFPKGSIITDLDLGLNISHAYTNQLEVALISPFGVKATVFNTNSCPNQYGEDINVVFNDQAYDIDVFNSFGIKSPAEFQCVPKIPAIGSYNKGTVISTGEEFTVGQMRPQGDHLKLFNGYPLNNENSKLFANVQFNEIDANTNRISSFEVFNLLNALGLTDGQRLTLRYESNTGGSIADLTVGSYYLFRVVDAFTIELLPENATDIVSVPSGSSHKFQWASTWVLQVYDNSPVAGGKVNDVCLHITWGLPTALKPTVKDNTEACGIMLTWSDLDQPNPCYNNVIRRRWVATDMFTNSRACIQRVSFEDETPLVVQFPCDVTVSCNSAATSLEGFDINAYIALAANRPVHSGDCESVGIEPIVHELTVVPGACRKYIVKWKVIDWCQYDKNSTTQTPGGIALSFADLQEWFPTLPWHNQCSDFIPGFPNNILAFEDDGDGYFELTQYIKLIDVSKPVFASCKDTVICSSAACQQNVTLVASASDVCSPSSLIKYSWKVDAFNDGTIEFTSPFGVSSNTFNATVPFGKHRITWTATDGCGNFTTCSYIFYVKDCKKPTPVCINGLSAPNMPVQQMVTIWASDWENGSSYDNCCAFADLVFRVEKTKTSNGVDVPTTTSITFDCTEIGSQAVRVWVGDCGYDENSNGTIEDSERNWDFCETFILITDNDGVCPNNPMASVVGKVETETGVAVGGVNLTAVAAGYNFMTGNNGQFSFLLPTLQSYTVIPEKDNLPLNGVNTLDIINITNHILGKKALATPYKKIAADVNKDEKVSSSDLLQIRKLILNITTEFPGNTSWRFVDKSFKFLTNNELTEDFNETIQLDNLNGAQNLNFVGVKIGDVTNNVNPNAAIGNNETRSANKFILAVAEQNMTPGQEYKVNFTAKDFMNVGGYQFTIGFDVDALDFIGIEGVAADITGENFGLTFLESGKITSSWNGKSITTLTDNDVLFSITFKANKTSKLSQSISINSSLTPAMAFDANEEAMDVVLEFNNHNGTIESSNFELYQNEPNPFKEFTTIKFDLPEASQATLTIYDVTGKVVKAINGDFAKGSNLVRIDRTEVPAFGTMYYQLDTDTHSAVKKMIIIE